MSRQEPNFFAFLNDIVAVLPLLTQKLKNLSGIVKTIVDDLVSSLKDLDRDHVKAIAEARAVCHELLQMVMYSDTYMATVDNFAWYAMRKNRHNLVLKALQRKRGARTQPLKEYLSQLTRSLGRTEESHQQFEKSFHDITWRLQTVLSECSKNVRETKRKRLTTGTLSACGMVIGGASAGASFAASMGIGSMLMLCLTTAAGTIGITATIGVTHYMSNEYWALEKAIKILRKNVATIQSIAQSIQSTITDVWLKLDGVRNIIDDIELSYEIPDSLIECLQLLFEKFVEVGTTCSNCYQDMTEKKRVLKITIDDL